MHKRLLQQEVQEIVPNELPLRHLFQHLDGRTTGPRDFAGTIGKALENCEQLPVVNFTAITGNGKWIQKISVVTKNIYTRYVKQFLLATAQHNWQNVIQESYLIQGGLQRQIACCDDTLVAKIPQQT